MMHIFKVIGQIDKYEKLKKHSPNDPTLKQKLAIKIPIFEKAIQKLMEKKASMNFVSLDKLRSPNPKKENTIGFNSTMNDYSDLAAGRTRGPYHESFKMARKDANDSDFASINKMFDSVKTDTVSRMSEKQFISDLKMNELVNDATLVTEKLNELQEKFAALVNSN